MRFELLPATLSDVPDLARLARVAFSSDNVIGHLMPNVPIDVRDKRDITYYENTFSNPHLFGTHIFKIVNTDTNAMVAFAKWQYACPLTPGQKEEKAGLDAGRPSFPEGANVPLCTDFFGQLDAGKKRIDPEKDFYLHILTVDPAHQRRGLGTMLLEKGLEEADKAGAKTFIEATVPGLPLYLRHGFEEVDEIKIDMGKYGGHGTEVQKRLTRPARQR